VFDPTLAPGINRITCYSVPDGSNFCVENDCLLSANIRGLVQYQGTSHTFCVTQAISVLCAGSFALNSSLITLVFDSLADVSFEEGLVRIGSLAFHMCRRLENLAFPASLEVIGKSAFAECRHLRNLRFCLAFPVAARTEEAFVNCYLRSFPLPATVKEIDISVFRRKVWLLLTFCGRPPLSVIGSFFFQQICEFY
jgi:hypothetical protein